jgi:hypothetical protein
MTDLSASDGKHSQSRITELPKLPYSPHVHDIQLCLLPKQTQVSGPNNIAICRVQAEELTAFGNGYYQLLETELVSVQSVEREGCGRYG